MHKKMCPRCGQVGLEYAQEQPTDVFLDLDGGEHKAVTSYHCPNCSSDVDLDHVRGMWR
jgi:ribosomal protein S27AE